MRLSIAAGLTKYIFQATWRKIFLNLIYLFGSLKPEIPNQLHFLELKTQQVLKKNTEKSEYEKNKNDVKNIGFIILERYFANLINNFIMKTHKYVLADE